MASDRFSRRGTPPTAFEVSLLQAAAGDGVWLDIARRLMADLGAVEGAKALLVVLDTLGTEKIHVPCRETLFRTLYRPLRNNRVLELLAGGNKTTTEIAAAVGVSERWVQKIAKRSGRQLRKDRVGRRA